MTYRRTTAIVVVAWLYLLTGAAMLVAPLFAFQVAAGLGPNLALLPLGGAVAAAGLGLLRGAAWAWPLTGLIAVSGVAVTVARLAAGGAPEGLVPPLLTNLITVLVLWSSRGARSDDAAAR